MVVETKGRPVEGGHVVVPTIDLPRIYDLEVRLSGGGFGVVEDAAVARSQ